MTEKVKTGKEMAVHQQERFQILPKDLTELMNFANMIAKSDLAGPAYKGNPGNCAVAIQMGLELGVSPLAAIQNIAVINGHATAYGDLILGLLMAHPKIEYVKIPDIQEVNKTNAGWCEFKRKDTGIVIRQTFTLDDAKKANLAGKDTYKAYTADMLIRRAIGRAASYGAADIMNGLGSREEMEASEAEIIPMPSSIDDPAPTPPAQTTDTHPTHTPVDDLTPETPAPAEEIYKGSMTIKAIAVAGGGVMFIATDDKGLKYETTERPLAQKIKDAEKAKQPVTVVFKTSGEHRDIQRVE